VVVNRVCPEAIPGQLFMAGFPLVFHKTMLYSRLFYGPEQGEPWMGVVVRRKLGRTLPDTENGYR